MAHKLRIFINATEIKWNFPEKNKFSSLKYYYAQEHDMHLSTLFQMSFLKREREENSVCNYKKKGTLPIAGESLCK